MTSTDFLLHIKSALPFVCMGFAVAGAGAAESPPVTCADRSSERHAYFGDLHIHTGLSADAMLFGTVNRPADAYRFARGEEIQIRQTSPGAVPRPGWISRPLDFAAVTDHAENMGAISLCLAPGSDAYDSAGCQLVREPLEDTNMATFAEKLGSMAQLMPDAYERLIMDVIRGDQTLFMRGDEVEAAWAWAEPIIRSWEDSSCKPSEYDPGSSGPEDALMLMHRDGRKWREIVS